MSRVSPWQVSLNGGEISRRLRARIDQSLYPISLGVMLGWAPLVEGVAEAMPGTIHIAQAPGPCRLLRFEYNTTQGQVVEASDLLFRIYTNDGLLTDGEGDPVEVASPYTYAEVQSLKTHQSYDVLYCFLGTKQPREFARTGADTFEFNLLELENGPFDPRNKDESVTVYASGPSGNITLKSQGGGIFAATDVGSLFKMEAGDFGDTPAWEPGVTVTAGQFRTSLERVYRAIGSGRTGSLQPSHTEGVEWDGMKEGTDVNDNDAGGVQWEYVHDKIGICEITGFTSASEVSATVKRRLPFTAVGGADGTSNDYSFTSDYDDSFDPWTTPGAAYQYGTWRWAFGAFSDTRGWPTAGVVWNERLCLVKDSTLYASVAADFTDFSEINELGELSNDMAFTALLADPNPILELAADDKLLLFTAAGCWALGPASAAQGVGPKNIRVDRQHHSGSSSADAVALDGRTLTISRCGTRIFETDYDARRQIEDAVDLTRYARHLGKERFTELAQQQLPHNHIWACRGDGTLVCGAYLPQEDVLGLARRNLATGVEARSIVDITDPDGRFDQIWLAVEYGGGWHVLLMAPWREDGESDDTGVMVDMAIAYEGEARASFTHPVLPNAALHVVGDGRFYKVTTDGSGAFTLDFAHERVVAGLPFEAVGETLNIEAGGDTGPARGKVARIARAWMEVISTRGLAFGDPSAPCLQDQEQIDPGDEESWEPVSEVYIIERAGDYTRKPRIRFERRAPFQATVAGIGVEMEVKQK